MFFVCKIWSSLSSVCKEKLQESMNKCTGHHDITEIMLKIVIFKTPDLQSFVRQGKKELINVMALKPWMPMCSLFHLPMSVFKFICGKFVSRGD